MAGKPITMLEVAHQTLNKITDSNEDWSAFLDSAAWQYKRSFLDAVLIYEHRQNATACASMETWNTHKQLLRLIKPGSKAIYLLRPTTDGEFGVTWVFDVADTYSPTGNPFSLWTLPHGQQEQFIQELFQAFPNGDQGNKGLNLSDSIYSITSNYLEQHYSLALDHLFGGAFWRARWLGGFPLWGGLPPAPAPWASSLRFITSPAPSA